jgi:class 3 adenylate cyclase
MKTRTKFFLNTVSLVLILLSLILFFTYIFYTLDHKNRQLHIHRQTVKFVLSLVDERVQVLLREDDASIDEEEATSRNGRGFFDVAYRDIVESITDYFDLDGNVHILVFGAREGRILYPSSSREHTVSQEVIAHIAKRQEGELNQEDRFGYFVRYGTPELTFYVYTLNSELFLYRNQLLYLLTILIALFTIFMIIIQKRVWTRWSGFLRQMGSSFTGVLQGKRNIPEKVDDTYGDEFGEFPARYNSVLGRIGSILKQLEEKVRSLFKERDNLKKMIYLYRKYIPDEALLKMDEKEVGEVVNRKQEVTCLCIELVNFLKPIDELYPQVVTGELNNFHVFLKEEVKERNGIINFSHGYFINIVYGVPHIDDASFNHACVGARRIVEWVDSRNRSEKNLSGVKWDVKIGLAHGTAVTGIVGSGYIVIGNVIEKSMRMLQCAKRFDVPLVSDAQSKLETSENFQYRILDVLKQGDRLESPIFEVFLKEHDMIEQAIKLYTHGLQMYNDRKYEMAVLDFKKVNDIFHGDNPARIFLKRSEKAIKKDLHY